MVCVLGEFLEMRKSLNRSLKIESGEPLSCQLYECSSAAEVFSINDGAGDFLDFHVAEACNIAGLIASIERILSLPKSNVACNEMSEIFLLSLDVLREYIRAAVAVGQYYESEADKTIRAWAGFIKHPKDYVFAHRCLSDIYVGTSSQSATITSRFLKSWDGLTTREKDAKKSDLAHRLVFVEFPSVDEISDFFDSCAVHLQALIKSFTRSPEC